MSNDRTPTIRNKSVHSSNVHNCWNTLRGHWHVITTLKKGRDMRNMNTRSEDWRIPAFNETNALLISGSIATTFDPFVARVS